MAPSWSNYITNSQVSQRLRSKLDIVGEILSYKEKDCIERLASSEGLAFIGVNEGNVTTFHHFEHLKGSVERPSNNILVCLTGLAAATMVVAPTMADVNLTVSSLVPNFDQLASCETTEELRNLRPDAKVEFKSKRLTPVQSCFIVEIAQSLCVSSDPGEILLDLLPLYVKFAASPQQDKANPYVHSRYFLQFLWVAMCSDAELSVRTSVPVHPKLDSFFSSHLHLLLPPSPPQPTNINDGLVTATSRLTAVIKDASLLTQQAAPKQKGWDSMISELQALILYASSTNCSDPADAPSDSLRKILEVKSTAASVTRVELLLMRKSGREFSPPAPLITNIRAGSFSGAPEKGAGISIFYFFNPSNSLTSKNDMAALQIQATEGTKLSVKQISMKLTNSKDYISFPTSVHILKEGL